MSMSQRPSNPFALDDFTDDGIARVRDALVAGEMTPAAFRTWLTSLPVARWDDAVDTLFGLDPFVADGNELPPGCVPYIAAPASALVRLVSLTETSAGATFVDVGCGVGRAAMLVHLLTGWRAIGVEIQSHLVELGTAAARRLCLKRVELRRGNACEEAALPDGDIYFMYCPFDARRVRRVLEILERRALRREITIVGLQVNFPCCEWLGDGQPAVGDLRVHRSRRP